MTHTVNTCYVGCLVYEARPTGLELLASWIKTLAGEAWQPETNPWNLPKAGKRKTTTESSLWSPHAQRLWYTTALSPPPLPE